jgi:hypothetical protein
MYKFLREQKISDFSVLLSSLSFLGVLVSLTRQFPFSFLSSTLSVFLLLSLLAHFYFNHKMKSRINVVDLTFLTLLLATILGYSIARGNSPLLIIRFFTVIVFINVVLLFKVGNVSHLKVFKYVYLLQSIIIIVLGVTIPILFDITTFSTVRSMFLQNQWGDIYSHNGLFFRVQLIGNALMPIFFFLSYIQYRESNVQGPLLLCISFLGCAFAGNLAFLLAMFMFLGTYEIRRLGSLGHMINKYKLMVSFALVMLIPIFIHYVLTLLLMKSDGSGSSVGTRVDQISVLINSMNANYITLLFGNGIGYTLNVISPVRDYKGSVYFELQALYFLNQLGFIPFTTLFLFHIYLFIKRISDFNCRLIYFIYLFYASINPYFLDSSHVAVLILLLALNTYQEKNRKEQLISYIN